MGCNVLFARDAVRALNVRDYETRSKLFLLVERFARIPFSIAQLEAARDDYLLVATLPLSLNFIFSQKPGLFCSDWLSWQDKPIAKITGFPSWRLVRKTPEPGSLDLLWVEQERLAKTREIYVPPPRVMAYATIMNYLIRGERLFGGVCVRCFGKDSLSRWEVGRFGADGIVMLNHAEDCHSEHVGLASGIRHVELSQKRKTSFL